MKRLRLLVIALLVFPLVAVAETFRIADIRVEGLQRVSAGTVFAALPVKIGDTMDTASIQSSTRALFSTGFFEDITIGRDGPVLIIAVVERPAIAEIKIEGNKAIKTEDLEKGMTQNGLTEGQIFKRSTLEGLTKELQRQYVAQGRYSADVETEVVELPQNQVRLEITVDEGKVAAIKHINVVGNRAFSDEDLIDMFELRTTGWFSWLSGNDRYSKEKLSGDIERLESHYLDRGFLDFNIDSTQVSLTPDKEAVYITVNITEGDVYTVSSVELAGDLIVPEEDVRALILLQEEQTFSQVLMTTTSEYITTRLGNEGYTFAEVRGIPERNAEENTVKITFFMDPGKRAYVRRVNFRGNTKTADEVLRREMRQMEGGSASTALIEQSKVRLERLGYFKEVTADTTEVPGTSDQVDVDVTVEEQASGSIGASVGFAQGAGLVLGANIQQNNWFGTGKAVGFNVSTSTYQTVYSFNYTDPYFTPDGVSRGFNVFFRSRDLDEVNVASYSTDTFGGAVNFGYPISETARLNFGLGYTNVSIETGAYAAKEITTSPALIDENRFLREYIELDRYNEILELISDNEAYDATTDSMAITDGVLTTNPDGWVDVYGDAFNIFTVSAGWRQSTLNRGSLATRGASQAVNFEISLPGGDLEYYKLTYSGQYFRPLTKSLTLRLRTELGYAEGYGGTPELPFFENFYAGGFGSVRGFTRNTLGPHATPADQYVTVPAQGIDTDGDGDIDRYSEERVYVLSDSGKLLYETLDDDDDPFGGNILIEGSAEIIFPMPFIKDQRSVQSSLFLDAGNVFDTNCGVTQNNCYDVDLSKISAAVGVGVTWITGFGPLTFSIAKPVKEQEGDDPEFFQFSLGTAF